MNITYIADRFLSTDKAVTATLSGIGNINKTFLIKTQKNKKYILQQINQKVFNKPYDIMHNIDIICNHLLSQGEKALIFLKDSNGKMLYIDEYGNYWRMCEYFENSRTFINAQNCVLAYYTGKAYGNFQNKLSQLNCSDLKITIKDFHNTKRYFELFKKNIQIKKSKKVMPQYEFLSKVWQSLSIIQTTKLNTRVCHNDTKIDNILFEENNFKPIVVIDLDTVMPGNILDDYGDCARSVSSSCSENESCLSKIYFDLNKFKAFSRGYLIQLKKNLTKYEKACLNYAPAKITFELAIRFLNDYLNNNVYFSVKYPEHNLERANNQIALLKDILKKQNKINEIIDDCLRE